MKIVKPHVELVSHTPEPEKLIERMGRICYKSEDKIAENSAPEFIKMLLKRGHESVLEHAAASFIITTDRGVTHEIVRHRLASYSQECVAGTAKVSKDLTVEQLYAAFERKRNLPHLRSCREDGTIVKNAIERVFYKGVAPTYRVSTRLGYQLDCTKQHEFMLPGGDFKRLREIRCGDAVLVNGRPCLLKIDDDCLKTLYVGGMSPIEIADEYGVAYAGVLRRLKHLGIFRSHLNDKHPEKYNSQHTRLSYAKMREIVLQQYRDGRVVWNKDLREGSSESVDRQAESLRAHHHSNLPGLRSSNWKGGVSQAYYTKLVPRGPCRLCSAPNAKEVHHWDRNRRNNSIDNLLRICINCHDKLHHGWHVGCVAHPDEVVSIVAIGSQGVFDIEMAAPYHNYVADGFVVHNSWIDAVGKSEECYLSMLDNGISPQIARSVLPNCLKSDIGMTANFREWRHFLKLRTSPAAHPQMQEVARTIAGILCTLSPACFAEFDGKEV